MKQCLLFYSRVGRLSVALIAACALGACSGSGLVSERVTLTVTLPETPPAISACGASGEEEPSKWTLVWYDACGTRQTASAAGTSAKISLDRGIFTPILAYPISRGRQTIGLPPAGALFPADADTGDSALPGGVASIDLDWTGGLLADAARAVCSSSDKGFDTGRLIAAHVNWEKCRERISGFSDQGAFDAVKFVNAALRGTVTAYSVTERKKKAITIAAPVPPGTPFAAEHPLSPALVWPQSGAAEIPLADGHFRFFGAAGTLEGEVADGELRCVFFRPNCLQD